MDDKDLRYTVTREKFNKISKNIFSTIKEIEIKAQQYFTIKGIEIHSVELIGGGSRIPEFIKIAKEVFGQ